MMLTRLKCVTRPLNYSQGSDDNVDRRRYREMLLPKLILSPLDFNDFSLNALDVAKDVTNHYDL